MTTVGVPERKPAARPAQGEVHVWTADLDAVSVPDDVFAATLSPEELTRAQRFVFGVHRRRYLVAHAFLRTVLGDCLGRSPAAIVFGRTAEGKPILAAGAAGAVHFSLSHSGSVAACAVALVPVGVDVEREQAIPEAAGVAARIFTAKRLAEWSALPEPSRTLALLVAWTEFEALAKAQGGGLVHPPSPLELEGDTGRWHAVLDRGDGWSVCAVRPASGTVLGVAVRGGPARLALRGRRPWQGAGESTTLRES